MLSELIMPTAPSSPAVQCDAPAALLQRHPGPPLLVELDLGLGQVVVLLEQQLLAGVYQPPLGGRRRVRLVRVDQVLGLAQQPLQLAVLGEQPRLLLLQRVDVVRRLLQDRGLGTGRLVSIVSYSRPSIMIIASRTQFHVERPWGQRPFSIVS